MAFAKMFRVGIWVNNSAKRIDLNIIENIVASALLNENELKNMLI